MSDYAKPIVYDEVPIFEEAVDESLSAATDRIADRFMRAQLAVYRNGKRAGLLIARKEFDSLEDNRAVARIDSLLEKLGPFERVDE